MARAASHREWAGLRSGCSFASVLLAGWVAIAAVGDRGRALAQGPPKAPQPPEVSLSKGVNPEYPQGQLVETTDEFGDQVTARAFVRVGSKLLVQLPSGQIVERDDARPAPAGRKFYPESPKALAKKLATQFPRMQVRAVQDYVFISSTSEVFGEVTRRILTTMLPGIRKFARQQDLKIRAPEFPLVVVMFGSRREFEVYQSMPEQVLAYYNPWTNYVVLHEESPLARISRELAIREAIATIAHEGVHQILHNIGVQQRLSQWPMWLSEGLAEYFAPTRLGRRMSWKGAGKVNDMRMLELEHYVKAKAFGSRPGEMIEHTVGAAQLTSTGYATAWGLTHFLATKRRATFDDLLRDLAKTRPLEKPGEVTSQGLIPNNLEVFSRHFPKPRRVLEAELIAHLEKLPYTDPFASAPHVVALVTLSRGGDTGWKANIFHTQQQAKQWCAQYIDTLDEGIAPTVRLLQVPNRAEAERVIRRYAASQK